MAANNYATLDNYLQSVRSAYLSAPSQPIVIVMGNEASDADSTISALTLAHYLSNIKQFPNRLVIPLINIYRKHLHLRKDIEILLQLNGVPVDKLLFLDQIPLLNDNPNAASLDAQLILVDHNELADYQSNFGDHVVGIIDHHKDSKLYPQANQLFRLIEATGSCTTLVAQFILENYKAISEKNENKNDNEAHYWSQFPPLHTTQLSDLIMSVILLDTSNFSAKAKKATPADDKIYSFLHKVHQAAKFQHLLDCRNDISHLSVAELLLKDAKFLQKNQFRVNLSSIPMKLEDFLGKFPGFQADLALFCREFNYNALIVSFIAQAGGEIQRFLMIFTRECAELLEKLQNGLEKSELKLEKRENERKTSSSNGGSSENDTATQGCTIIYDQRNLGASRKQILPLVGDILSKL
jgi:inorganic pyrophosphatase/exopolyphosphatase